MGKYFYCWLLLAGFAGIANTQENRSSLIPVKVMQRSVMIGGSMSGAYKELTQHNGEAEYKSKRLQFDLDAKAGYFLLSDLALGLKAQATTRTTREAGDSHLHDSYFLAGPFVRYYVYHGFFGEASLMGGKDKASTGEKRTLTEAKGGVGYSFFINPKVAVEPVVMLTHFKEKRPGLENYSKEFGPSLNIGLQVYLFRERKFSLH